MSATTQLSGVSKPFSLRLARPLAGDMKSSLASCKTERLPGLLQIRRLGAEPEQSRLGIVIPTVIGCRTSWATRLTSLRRIATGRRS